MLAVPSVDFSKKVGCSRDKQAHPNSQRRLLHAGEGRYVADGHEASYRVVYCRGCSMRHRVNAIRPRTRDDEATPIFGIKMFPGYRDWRLVSVAHEEGKLDDLRAVLGNDIAIQAYREGKQEFPDGIVIARLAWAYTPSEENNKVFGQQQSLSWPAPPRKGFSSW